MSGVDRFNQRADLALAKQGVLTDKELLSIDDLRDAWNAQSDAFNSWDELGTDEIIWFAQQQAIARYAALAQPNELKRPRELEFALEFCGNPEETIARQYIEALEARAALAQPEPEGPTREDLKRLAIEWGHCTPEDFALEVLTRWGRPTIQPVPVAERLPEAGRKVIAHYLNALGNPRTILAEWVPAKSRTEEYLMNEDFAEYDEETDEYYWPEGWYESIENWDDYGAVFVNEGVITHWQPLPAGPALPTQPPITP